MAIKNCIFCGHELRPAGANTPHARTAEHVFAEWFRRISQHRFMNMYTGTASGDVPKFKRRPALTALTMKGVCKKCNNEWMSVLEDTVEPIMLRVFGGVDVDLLSTSEMEILARWTAKTAITLSYATPQNAPVPLQASSSLHPDHQGSVRFGFFYAKITSDPPLDNGHLQVVYGSELPLIGSEEIAGTRLALCLSGHCLIVDFPPADAGFRFDLSESCCMQLWPMRRSAGIAEFKMLGPPRTDRVWLELCQSITVRLDAAALRA
jgi:hypothetical protein